MGEAILSRLLSTAGSEPLRHAVSDVDSGRLAYLHKQYGVRVTPENGDAVAGADLIVLAVKPQDAQTVCRALAPALQPNQVALSIMAGITLAQLRNWLSHEAIVRAMPNTPARIGQGITVWTATGQVDSYGRERAQLLLAGLGPEIAVSSEHYLDLATAVSGSGPAYVFLIAEALTDAAVQIGLPRPMANELVLQTLQGSIAYLRDSGKHPAELKNEVTSPAGTTAAGLFQLERLGVRSALHEAVQAAYARAIALGNA